MTEEQSAARRRELQHKAFAPGGGLTDAETAELRELSTPTIEGPAAATRSAQTLDPATATAPAPAAAAPAAFAPAPAAPESVETELTAPDATTAPQPASDNYPAGSQSDLLLGQAASDSASDAASETDAEPASPERPTKPRRMVTLIAAATALLVGFGAGWLLFEYNSGPSMTDEQRATWAELESSGEYDDGSLEFAGSEQEASGWFATQDDGARQCLILTASEDKNAPDQEAQSRKEQTCLLSDGEESSWDLQVSLPVYGSEQTPNALFWAMAVRDVDGKLRMAIQRNDYADQQFDWRNNYAGTELEIATLLDSEGFSGDTLQIVGYDGETPVWLSYAGAQPCVLVADAASVLMQACGELTNEKALQVQGDGVAYSVSQTEMRGPVLTIIRTGTAINVETGEVIDDKTGEIGE